MVDDDDLTQERDNFLVSTFVSVAMHYRSAYHEWIQEELNHVSWMLSHSWTKGYSDSQA